MLFAMTIFILALANVVFMSLFLASAYWYAFSSDHDYLGILIILDLFLAVTVIPILS